MEVLDVYDPEFWLPVSGGAPHEALMGWLREHSIDPNVTSRVELHFVDAPFVRAFGHMVGEDGRAFCRDGPDGEPEVAMAPPRDVVMRSRPPVAFRPEDQAIPGSV